VPATRKYCTKHAPSPKSECGHLNGGKSKAVTYAFPPGYRENAAAALVLYGSSMTSIELVATIECIYLEWLSALAAEAGMEPYWPRAGPLTDTVKTVGNVRNMSACVHLLHHKICKIIFDS
jgi:hypothetical protein